MNMIATPKNLENWPRKEDKQNRRVNYKAKAKMFRSKKSTKSSAKTDILSSSQDIPTTAKVCKKLILDNTRWEASALDLQIALSIWSYHLRFLLKKKKSMIIIKQKILINWPFFPILAAITKGTNVINQRATTRCCCWCGEY